MRSGLRHRGGSDRTFRSPVGRVNSQRSHSITPRGGEESTIGNKKSRLRRKAGGVSIYSYGDYLNRAHQLLGSAVRPKEKLLGPLGRGKSPIGCQTEVWWSRAEFLYSTALWGSKLEVS